MTAAGVGPFICRKIDGEEADKCRDHDYRRYGEVGRELHERAAREDGRDPVGICERL